MHNYVAIYFPDFGVCIIPVGVSAIHLRDNLDFVTSSRAPTAGAVITANAVAIVLLSLLGLAASSWKNKRFLAIVSDSKIADTILCAERIHCFGPAWMAAGNEIHSLVVRASTFFPSTNLLLLCVRTL